MVNHKFSAKKDTIDELTRKTDGWILRLKRGDYTAENLSDLDLLPSDNFIKVVDYQEFEVLKMLMPRIHHHRNELLHCMSRKFTELSSEDRQDVINGIRAKLHQQELSNEEKMAWKQLLEGVLPARMKKAA